MSSTKSKIQGKVDVHHHIYPPVYTAAIERNGGDPSGWYIPPWTMELDHDICRQAGVGTAFLSCTAPGPDIEKDPKEAQKLARACNEFIAKVRDAEPNAYGLFAAVPTLLNTEVAIEEMRYALDELHADGITLMSRYGEDNHYLGHPDFIPIWDFLNARKAIVFVHPTHAVDTNLVNKHLPQPSWDYPHETSRAAMDMITRNMLRDHASDCKIILSHAGGDLPYLIDRAAGLLPYTPSSWNPGKTRDDFINEARTFYFDTALSSSSMHLKALMELLGEEKKDHLLFGTDFPNATSPMIAYFTNQLEGQNLVDVEGLRKNGLKLFPRLA